MNFTGWLAPDRSFIECRLYAHIQVILDLVKDDLELDHLVEEVEATRESCQRLEDEEGSSNAEWHCLETVESSARYEVYIALLDRGYIRVGSYARTIHFEGRPDVLEARKIELQDFCEERNCDWEFEPVRCDNED